MSELRDAIEETLNDAGIFNAEGLASDILDRTLKALETPTPEMIEAGAQIIPRMGGSNGEMGVQIFTAMIRAASVEDET